MTSNVLRHLTAAALLLATPAIASRVAAQAPAESDPLAVMREDLLAKRYADVIRRGNDLLGSSRAFTVAEQMLLWQVMAAAYYPPDVMAQRPDSARLPLDALIRLAPDAELARELRWPGLDSLLERSRAANFIVVSRPLPEYVITTGEPAHLTVVATRPARFRLTSISAATGVAVSHDSVAGARNATLRLRAHDGSRPLLANGDYTLRITAIDIRTGDSVIVTHQARARANAGAAVPAIPPFIAPASVRVPVVRRGALVVGGLAFAGATVALANGARAPEPIRSGHRADDRALLVGGAMVAAAVTALFLDRGRQRPPDASDIARARAAYDRRVEDLLAESKARAGRYRVTLTIQPGAR